MTKSKMIKDSNEIVPPNPKDLAWAAGFLSAMGTILDVPTATPRLVIKTVKDGEALLHFGAIVGASVRGFKLGEKRGYMIQSSGKPLHRIMTMLWPYLMKGRKKEYAAARKAYHARLEAEAMAIMAADEEED